LKRLLRLRSHVVRRPISVDCPDYLTPVAHRQHYDGAVRRCGECIHGRTRSTPRGDHRAPSVRASVPTSLQRFPAHYAPPEQRLQQAEKVRGRLGGRPFSGGGDSVVAARASVALRHRRTVLALMKALAFSRRSAGQARRWTIVILVVRQLQTLDDLQPVALAVGEACRSATRVWMFIEGASYPNQRKVKLVRHSSCSPLLDVPALARPQADFALMYPRCDGGLGSTPGRSGPADWLWQPAMISNGRFCLCCDFSGLISGKRRA
jgi:hypothetical protein